MTPLEHALVQWLEALTVRALSRSTIVMRRRCLTVFIAWCAERGVDTPAAVTRSMIERYQRHLYYYRMPERSGNRKRDAGLPLSLRTQHLYLSALTLFFGWLTRQRWIAANPATELDLPRSPRHLPRIPLTLPEVAAVLALTSARGELGVRDRAIMETFYATGIRSMELAHLTIYDVDTLNRTLLVREGKGGKDRLLPIGERACDWIDKYIADVRPRLLIDVNEQRLFLTYRGAPFSPSTLCIVVRSYFKEAGVTKPGACHLFRHTMATAMLDNGADLRHIQAMLGHANIETTTIYTHVSLRTLRDVYERTHPGRTAPTRTHDAAGAERSAVLNALDAEAAEESDAAADTTWQD
jgi:integrase/recombinase XerD